VFLYIVLYCDGIKTLDKRLPTGRHRVQWTRGVL